MVRNNATSEEVLKKCGTPDFVPTLAGLLETYKNNQGIMNSATELLLAISNKYPGLVSKVGQKSFVRALTKETKTALKTGSDSPSSLVQANQNLRCLVTMAENPETLKQIIEEGGDDLAVSMIENYIRENKDNDQPRDRAASQLSQTQVNESGAVTIETFEATSENLVKSSLELLDKILDAPKDQRPTVNPNLAKGLVDILESTQNVGITLNTLKVIEKATNVEELATLLSDNEHLEKIMQASNNFSESPEVGETVGKILVNLGANSMIPQVAEQVVELSQGLDVKDPESRESYLTALNYYGNLLEAPKNTEVEGELEGNIVKAMQTTLQASKDDPELVETHIKIIEKLASRDEKTRAQLRNSPISEALMNVFNGTKSGPSNRQTLNSVIRTIRALGQDEESTHQVTTINGETGAEVADQGESDVYVNSLLKSNNGASIDKLLEIVEEGTTRSTENESKAATRSNLGTIRNAIAVLNELARKSAEARERIIQKNGATIVTNAYQNKLAGSHNKEGAKEAIKLLGNLAKAKESHQTIAVEPVLDRVVKDIADVDFESIIRGEGDPALAEAGLALIQNLSDNDGDHNVLKEKRLPESILNLINKFSQVPKQTLIEKRQDLNTIRVLKTVSSAMQALKKMLPDPLLAKAAIKAQCKENVLSVLDTLSEASTAPEEVDSDKLNQLTSIISSNDAFNKCIEDTLSVVEELSGNPKYSKEVNLVSEESTLYQDVLNLMSNIPDNSMASYRTLQICKNSLQALGKEKILETSQETLAPLPEVADTLISLYPNIPVIVSLAEDVKSLVTTGLTVEEAQKPTEVVPQVSEHDKALEVLEQAKQDGDVGVIADTIEELTSKVVSNEGTAEEQTRLLRATEILKELAKEEDKAAKIQQNDLVNPLSQLLSKNDTSKELKENIVEILGKISSHESQATKLATNSQAIHSLADYIKQDGNNALAASATDDSREVKSVVVAAETIEKLIEIGKVSGELPEDLKMNNVTSSLCVVVDRACKRDNPQVAASVSRTLATLTALNEESARTVESTGVVDNLIQNSEKFDTDLRFATNYAMFIASNANTPQKRTEFAKGNALQRLNAATKNFPDDLDLNFNTCLAHTSLMLKHPENTEAFLKSEAPKHIEYQTEKFKDQHMIVEGIAILVNTLTSNKKDSTNAKTFGSFGAAKWFTNLTSSLNENTEETTVVECLKAVNNLSASEENAQAFADQDFVKVLQSLLRKQPSSKVSMLVASNLGNLAARVDAPKVTKLIQDGAVETIVEYLYNFFFY